MCIITKYILGYITTQNLFSLDLNRTVQGNHNTAKNLHNEMHHEVRNVLHNKMCFGFVKQAKNKVLILN